MDSDSDNSVICTPPGVVESANKAILDLIPDKSKEVYERTYLRFMEWREAKQVVSFSENVLIAYFAELSKKVKPSTLWGHYSMLKATLNVKQDINIKNYPKIIPYLKKNSYGYQPKKSKILSKEEVSRFLTEAPDQKYLMTKVALIFGLAGALRRDELAKMCVEDIRDLGSALLINIPNTKTKKPRSFTVTGEQHLNLYKKYSALRPDNMNVSRFFLKYQNGKCCRQVVGIHKISSVAQEVATFLKLPNSHLYTGHCLRRTSATLYVDAGANLTALKRHGGWQSSSVAEGYIGDSITNKIETATKILNFNEASSSKTKIVNVEATTSRQSSSVAEGYISDSITNKIETATKILNFNEASSSKTKIVNVEATTSSKNDIEKSPYRSIHINETIKINDMVSNTTSENPVHQIHFNNCHNFNVYITK